MWNSMYCNRHDLAVVLLLWIDQQVELCVIVILQAAAGDALPAFFIEYNTTDKGTVDTGVHGKCPVPAPGAVVFC